MKHPLLKLLNQKNETFGIYSACSANPFVLEACMEKALNTKSLLLIEATANQVDQHGGYTGMTPKDFYAFIESLAKKVNVPMSQIVLGGDHLGPLTFSHLNEEEAMNEAKVLIREYVLAGFTKIHIDTSMRVKDDSNDEMLSNETIAKRGAILVKEAEEAYKTLLKSNPDAMHPIYVVGSEVPIPGGAQDESNNEMQVTKPADFKESVRVFKKKFEEYNLSDSWNYVIAFVVQPGVEEKDSGCTDYDPKKATDLLMALNDFENLVFEGHSTDYQTSSALTQLVKDGVKILKVGPGLTFSLREALFSLSFIEKEILHHQKETQSNFMEILEEAMLENDVYWKKYYHGTSDEIALKRKYSFSDRSRYYLPTPKVQKAIDKLIKNLQDNPIPLNTLSQFMPIQYRKVRLKQLENDVLSLIKDVIGVTIDDYLSATHQEKFLD
ncbi:MAG: class II D-tagatose-bisphosphate aldolase, non-catalytic subunit [Anaerorhabdus sp.]